MRPGRNGKSGLVPILPIDQIRPAPENESIYRPISEDDPAVQALAESVAKSGILDPLVITQDGFILSGHRRYFVANLLGLKKVPCRIDGIKRTDPGFLRRLTEYNHQRVKGIEEILHEEVIRTDPETSHRDLLQYRRERAQVHIGNLARIELRDYQARAEISKAKGLMLAAVTAILEANYDYWPFSVRQVHYQLLNDPPLIHASKPDSIYRNTKKSYKRLVDLIARARLEGLIEWEAIADETRPVISWDVHADTSGFIRQEIADFFKDYARNLLQSQPNHIEIVGEKNTIQGIIRPVCAKYGVPFTIGRGFCSLEPRHQLVERFAESGKENLILLVLSDFDADGVEIAHSFARSLRDDFQIDEDRITPIQVALTPAQVRELGLVPNLTAKEKSINYNKFVSKYGRNTYELEAIPAGTLQNFLDQAIRSVLDIHAFNAEIEQEKRDAAYLAAVRKSVNEVLSKIGS
jgi:ParB-like chromosome segregation protein Spo0J